MQQKFLRLTILAAIIAGFSSCEDKIDLKVPAGTSYPVLDAWITTAPGPQQIKITMSVPYTQQTAAPVVSDATITLYDETNGQSYPFTFKDTAYVYDPGDNVSIGIVGHAYRLKVQYKTDTFEAVDTIKRVASIYNMTYKYKTDTYGKDGYYARFYAIDPAGAVDYSWIRSYRNTKTSANIIEDLYAEDGSYEAVLGDGQEFNLNIEERITDDDHPYKKGDKAIVQMRSLTYQSYFFITSVQNQLDNGGLFATVLANVGTNAINVTNGGGTYKLLGWFGTSAQSNNEIDIE